MKLYIVIHTYILQTVYTSCTSHFSILEINPCRQSDSYHHLVVVLIKIFVHELDVGKAELYFNNRATACYKL